MRAAAQLSRRDGRSLLRERYAFTQNNYWMKWYGRRAAVEFEPHGDDNEEWSLLLTRLIVNRLKIKAEKVQYVEYELEEA